MIEYQDSCKWMNVSFGDGSPGTSRTRPYNGSNGSTTAIVK